MICTDCGKKEAIAKGLCSTCYARHRRKNGAKKCSVEGCSSPAVIRGLCSKHAQQARAQAMAKKIPDRPGEEWKNLPDHPGWMISTSGRVKSLRGRDERLITPRIENGRLFIEDGKYKKSFSVHLQVLKIFRPNATGDPIFINGDVLNPSLENLKWDTRAEKIQRAIAMAEQSTSPWAQDFAAYWRDNKHALDRFFEEMRLYLLKAVRKKVDASWGFFPLDLDGLVNATLVKFFFSVHAATIKCLEGVTGYLLTIADNLLRKHWRYTKSLVPIEIKGEGQNAMDDVTNIDMAGYAYPSAELVAISREME